MTVTPELSIALTEEELWSLTGGGLIDLGPWQDLLADPGESSQAGGRVDAVTWALTWLHTNQDFWDAHKWVTLDLATPTAELPNFAAACRDRRIDADFVASWHAVGFAAGLRHVGALTALADAGWTSDAVALLADLRASKQDRVDGLDVAELVRYCIPPHVVLDGARAGLSLKSAISTARATLVGIDSEALLARLIERRGADQRLGAQINVAVAFLGERVSRTLWATPPETDQRLTRSIRASLPRELWSQFDAAPPRDPLEVVDPSGGRPGAWTRGEDGWGLISPPEDCAVQPEMSWRDGHQIHALREYLNMHLAFLEVDEYYSMSWPPTGTLWSEGSWGDYDEGYCSVHDDRWEEACEECAACLRSDRVLIHRPAEWHWHCRITKWREDGGSIEEIETEYWHVESTEMDPRSVHFE